MDNFDHKISKPLLSFPSTIASENGSDANTTVSLYPDINQFLTCNIKKQIFAFSCFFSLEQMLDDNYIFFRQKKQKGFKKKLRCHFNHLHSLKRFENTLFFFFNRVIVDQILRCSPIQFFARKP